MLVVSDEGIYLALLNKYLMYKTHQDSHDRSDLKPPLPFPSSVGKIHFGFQIFYRRKLVDSSS